MEISNAPVEEKNEIVALKKITDERKWNEGDSPSGTSFHLTRRGSGYLAWTSGAIHGTVKWLKNHLPMYV